MASIGKRVERRKFQRLEFVASAYTKRYDVVFSGEIRNISNMGACFATSGLYAVNEPIDLTIYFQHGATKLSVTVPCRVARLHRSGVGLVSAHIDAIKLLQLDLIFDLNKQCTHQLVEEVYKSA